MHVCQPEWVAPFAAAVREVFRTMAAADVTVGAPYAKVDGAPEHGVCGIIGFHGQITGSMAVRFGDEAAGRLVTAFVGVALPPGGPDFVDAVGELANLVAGCAKGKMSAVAGITTPSVVLGGYTPARPSGAACVVLPCACVHGEFAIEISIAAAASAA